MSWNNFFFDLLLLVYKLLLESFKGAIEKFAIENYNKYNRKNNADGTIIL